MSRAKFRGYMVAVKLWQVLSKLSIGLETTLIGRFNRLLRHVEPSKLTSLSIHMAPDDRDPTRMQIFELKGLRLVDLTLRHSAPFAPIPCFLYCTVVQFSLIRICWSAGRRPRVVGWVDFGGRMAGLRLCIALAGKCAPVFSPHHLPTTLRSLTFAGAYDSSENIFAGAGNIRCTADLNRSFRLFAEQLPASVTCLRFGVEDDICNRVEALQQYCNLEELDIYVRSEELIQGDHICVSMAETLTNMSLRRLGLHQRLEYPVYSPDINATQMHRTCYICEGTPTLSLEEQIDQTSCHRVTKLTLHIVHILSCPSLSVYSALAELVVGDGYPGFGRGASCPFALQGLEAVTATLRRLSVSSFRKETYVELPQGLRLSSFVCVSKGNLRLECDAQKLITRLGDVLLGYMTIAGAGVTLVKDLRPRLEEVVLSCQQYEDARTYCHRQRLNVFYTRAGLVGEWWYGVLQPTKDLGGWDFSRLEIWARGMMCPSYLTFLRYGIISPHESRDVYSCENGR
jgi:hypothetical protein